MKHYTKEELDLFRNGKMSLLGKISCSGHLKNCQECAKLLEELSQDDRFIDELRSSVLLFQELSGTANSTPHATDYN